MSTPGAITAQPGKLAINPDHPAPAQFDWQQALEQLAKAYPYDQRGGIALLAADIGVSYSALAKWRSGSEAPSLKSQNAIADLHSAKIIPLSPVS
jgi:hypothetical protein